MFGDQLRITSRDAELCFGSLDGSGQLVDTPRGELSHALGFLECQLEVSDHGAALSMEARIVSRLLERAALVVAQRLVSHVVHVDSLPRVRPCSELLRSVIDNGRPDRWLIRTPAQEKLGVFPATYRWTGRRVGGGLSRGLPSHSRGRRSTIHQRDWP
jgi:hypothetical protein